MVPTVNNSSQSVYSASSDNNIQHLLFIQEEFAKMYRAFQDDPSAQNAQKMLSFLQDNKSDLKSLYNLIHLDPINTFNYDSNFDGIIAALQHYNPSMPAPAFEFLNNMRTAIGADYNPQDVFNGMTDFMNIIQQMIEKFGVLHNASIQDLLCVFNSKNGFIKDLSMFAKDPAQFEKDAAAVEAATLAYQQDRSADNLAALQQAVAKVQDDLS